MQDVRFGDFTFSGLFGRPPEQNQESFLWTASKVVGFIGLLVATSYASYWHGAHQAAQAGGEVYEESIRNLMDHFNVEEIVGSAGSLVRTGAEVGSLAKAFTEHVYNEMSGFDLNITTPYINRISDVVENTVWWGKAGMIGYFATKTIQFVTPLARFIAKRP